MGVTPGYNQSSQQKLESNRIIPVETLPAYTTWERGGMDCWASGVLQDATIELLGAHMCYPSRKGRGTPDRIR